MYYKIAFDKKDELEIFVFNHMFYDSEKKLFFSTYKMEHFIGPIGSFLLMFLNTDFENDDECKSFIFWFCFENLYYKKYPEIKQANRKTISQLKLSFSEFVKELDEISNENKEEFLYLKQTLLKNLRLMIIIFLENVNMKQDIVKKKYNNQYKMKKTSTKTNP